MASLSRNWSESREPGPWRVSQFAPTGGGPAGAVVLPWAQSDF